MNLNIIAWYWDGESDYTECFVVADGFTTVQYIQVGNALDGTPKDIFKGCSLRASTSQEEFVKAKQQTIKKP
jgi:hypothetical protein